jgi:hypothetical protein
VEAGFLQRHLLVVAVGTDGGFSLAGAGDKAFVGFFFAFGICDAAMALFAGDFAVNSI